MVSVFGSRMRKSVLILAVLFIACVVQAEVIRLATYNIENFNNNFEAYRLSRRAATQPSSPELQEELRNRRAEDDEDNWEIALTLLDEKCRPDILVIQECCDQKDLEFFNRRWLNGFYKTVIVFPGNSDRFQSLGMMLRPGFEVLERRDRYYLEQDPVGNARGERLFARGPAFCLVKAPSGYRFWVGVTHQKSMARNSLEATQWRLREARRTNQIIQELRRTGPDDVILLGDFNDTLGIGEFEKEAGGDVVASVAEGLFLATEKLAQTSAITFHGYWRDEHRSVIDHIVTTPEMKAQVRGLWVHTAGLAIVASDHYPLLIEIAADPAGN